MVRETAEATAALAKRCFEASQVLEPSDRVAALEQLRLALTDAKQEILEANKRDMEVGPHPAARFCVCSFLLALQGCSCTGRGGHDVVLVAEKTRPSFVA
jgi:gamma-glutamyl phosphate reductase